VRLDESAGGLSLLAVCAADNGCSKIDASARAVSLIVLQQFSHRRLCITAPGQTPHRRRCALRQLSEQDSRLGGTSMTVGASGNCVLC
jgi:hypothetical protein